MNWIATVSCIVLALQLKLDYVSAFCNKMSRYRTIDGSCNNYENPSWGTPNKPLARLLNNSYSDGKHAFPCSKCSKCNKSLVNPREISLKIFPDVDKLDDLWTVLTLQWGQLIAHDLSLIAGSSNTVCCRQGKYTIMEKLDPGCASIPIPPNDPYNAGRECYDFSRTQSTTNIAKANEQISGVTSYMDESPVYGSSIFTERDLRLYKGGRMKTEKRNKQEWLPQNHAVMATCDNVSSVNEPCYRAGDTRVNQNTLLSVLQNILLREHNRIADYLCNSTNGHLPWSDEQCYQEARRINIAMIQHINYYEFLPILLGHENMVNNKLIYPDAVGYVNDYDSTINPAVINEFTTSAFRNFHSSIVEQLRFYFENRETNSSVRLSDYMNKPLIIEEGDHFDQLTRCLSTQHQGAVDRYYSKEASQYLFRLKDNHGQDLRSIDIQRARDHGLGTYVDALIFCNLSNPISFEDLKKYIKPSSVILLTEIYKCVEDVELVVGGALETLLPDTLTGPTFQCIMTEQFKRTRLSDRFFYENGNNPGAFTLEQLKSIREGSTVASLLCNNADGVQKMQPQAFLKISEKNTLVPCGDLPQVNLTLWKENS